MKRIDNILSKIVNLKELEKIFTKTKNTNNMMNVFIFTVSRPNNIQKNSNISKTRCV
jgi:hypothetical protein